MTMSKSRNFKASPKVDIDVRIDLLSTICNYLFTESNHINKKSLMNIRKLFDMMNTATYQTDIDMFARISFIKSVLKFRIEEGLVSMETIYDRVRNANSSIVDDINAIINELDYVDPLGDEDVKSVNTWVSERLQNAHLFIYKDDIMDNFEALQIGDFDSITDINDKLELSCTRLLSDLRKAKADVMDNMDFDLTEDSFFAAIDNAVTDLSRPSNYIKTGIQYLNQMFGGGYECGRLYMYIGQPGGGKSVVLLQSALWAKQFNVEDITLKDPTKKPCIVFLSMENSIKETVERIFNTYYNDEKICNYTGKQVFNMLKSKGLSLDGDGINLKIMYRPNKSLSTDDLYALIEEIEDEGNEVVMFVLDYIKRIRPSIPTNDMRIDLGNITDELTVIAKMLNIPVVTATQMNREAIKKIEEYKSSGRLDVAKDLGKSVTGESMLIMENTDYAISICKEYKSTTNLHYMTFNNIKSRSKGGDVNYFAHPFEEGSQIHLAEDIDLPKSLSLHALQEQTASTDIVGQRGRTGAKKRNRLDTPSIELDDDMAGL